MVWYTRGRVVCVTQVKELCLRHDGVQLRGPSGNSLGSFPVRLCTDLQIVQFCTKFAHLLLNLITHEGVNDGFPQVQTHPDTDEHRTMDLERESRLL